MRIRHRELEACRVSPGSWVASQQVPPAPRKFGYGRALSLAICEFHKTESMGAATAKLNGYVTKNFTNEKRIEELYENLAIYAAWFNQAGIISADANVRILFPNGVGWQLGGLISRVDFTPTGYRAILFGKIVPGWQKELRMPLIQSAVAYKYGRPTSEVSLGMQELGSNTLEEKLFENSIRQQAEVEFTFLGSKVGKLWPKSRT